MEKEDEESRPNVLTYLAVIKGFVEKGRVMEGLGVLDRMEHSGLQPNRVTITALIDGLCKEGRVEVVHKVIDIVSRGSEQHAIVLKGWVLDRFGLLDSLEESVHFPAIDYDIYSIILAGLCEESHLVKVAKLANLKNSA
ncbi:unnamed protein product [Fraxinus pennsylvanica]|uniref:Pentatricopeptide repeat-containing protein n=1 Tax=Fraxinus pennsylvanica TaxID=56036 RepID=A0AAD2E6R0_9LAMI|nr:unnamed protein product [Fraxinus pennsylvanica]